jgi:uncharacterized RDD family membrane protein YckC
MTTFASDAPASAYVSAGFGARLVAFLLDGAFVAAFNIPVHLIFTPLFGSPAALAMHFAYAGYFLSLKGATPGKMLLGLRVIYLPTGGNPGWGTAFVREILGKLLSSVLLGLGYLIALFREDGRALHDLIADTRVVAAR